MDLLSEVAKLGDLTQEAVQLGRRTDQERRLEILQARKRQFEQLQKIHKASDIFAFPADGGAAKAEFRKRLSNLKSVIAYHQASWPVSAIDAAPIDYRKSADNLLKMQASFVAWTLNKYGS